MRIEELLQGAKKATNTVPFGATRHDPLQAVIGTMLSARTRDETTAEVAGELFKEIKTFQDILDAPEKKLEKTIKKIGFYKTKVKYMKGIAKMILEDFNGKVPETIEELILLPGVGRKTANLVIAVAFGKASICVDTHVHRIPNRTGVLVSKTPLQTEMILREIAPKKLWSDINRYIVPFGKEVCTPLSPRCSICPLGVVCPKIGVEKSR